MVEHASNVMSRDGCRENHKKFGEVGHEHSQFLARKTRVQGGSRYRPSPEKGARFGDIKLPRDATVVPGTTIQNLTVEGRNVFRCQSPTIVELGAFMDHVANSKAGAIVVLVSDAEYEKEGSDNLPKYFSSGPHAAGKTAKTSDLCRKASAAMQSVNNSVRLAERRGKGSSFREQFRQCRLR